MFILEVFDCVNGNVTVKVQHCINGDVNTDAENRSEPILYIHICIVIDTMLDFDGDTNADFKCEKVLRSW